MKNGRESDHSHISAMRLFSLSACIHLQNAQCSKRAEINGRLHKCVCNPNSLQVRHLPNNQTFNEGNLEVSTELHGKTVTWRPTPAATATLNGNLLGTIRVRPLLYKITPYSDCLNELHYTAHACYRVWTELMDL